MFTYLVYSLPKANTSALFICVNLMMALWSFTVTDKHEWREGEHRVGMGAGRQCLCLSPFTVIDLLLRLCTCTASVGR